VRLSVGGSIHDPTDPVGRLLFDVLAIVAEFETDLIRMRTREGMAVARAKGRIKGKQPKLTVNQARHLVELADLGTYSSAELAELFSVGCSTIYRTLRQTRPPATDPHRPFANHLG
jgi:DNA invertase Pin-like site-specific DNA recombinase